MNDDHNLCKNPNITWDILKHGPYHKHIDWDWWLLSYHPNITLDTVHNNYDLSWNFRALCANPNFIPGMVSNKVEIYVDYMNLSYNSNLTWKFISEHKNNLSYYPLSENKFDRWNASQKIQHTFRRWTSKTGVQACTLLLSDPEFLGDLFPVEVCHHIMDIDIVNKRYNE